MSAPAAAVSKLLPVERRRTKEPWRIISVALVIVALAACSEPLEFADWTVAPAEGTPIVEYADVPLEERGETVELVEDLVVGPRGQDPNYLFFRPSGVAVDDDGRMYVLEMGNSRVQVFDPDGEYIRTLGGPGQGPGELELPAGITIGRDQVMVYDLNSRRLSLWDLAGNHVRDVPFSGGLQPGILAGSGGSLVGATRRRLEDRSELIDVALFSTDGSETLRYTSLPQPEQFLIMGEGGGFVIPQLVGGPSYAASVDGAVYATAGVQYQILAFESSGEPRWALRVARPAPAFTQEHRDAVLDPLRDRFENLDAMELDWPTHMNTLGSLAVDGHGHLYVFAYTFRDMGPAEPTVEVYAPDGERLFAGTMREGAWSAARGDFVYEMRTNPDTEETELVRYRIVEPFDR